jgi:hypothetical protein
MVMVPEMQPMGRDSKIDIPGVVAEILRKIRYTFDEKGGLVVSKEEWKNIDDSVVDAILSRGEEGDAGEAPVAASHEAIILLGSYQPIPSKGILKLYTKNLSNFFWGLIKILYEDKDEGEDFRSKLSEAALHKLSEAAVAKTYYHEVFHYRCDIARILFGTRLDRNKEEALAVAIGHHYAKKALDAADKNSIDGRLCDKFLELAFDFRDPAYRGWRKYENMDIFRNEMPDHIIHPNALRLIKGAGGQIDGWFAGSLFLFLMDFPLDMMVEMEA